MAHILQVDEQVGVTGQLQPADLRDLAESGVTLIINNRPDGEEAGQPLSADMAAEADRLGMAFVNIPFVYPAPGEIIAFAATIKAARGKVVAYCRSGHRSSIIWATARVVLGVSLEEVVTLAGRAGLDLQPAVEFIEDLAKEAAQAQ